MSTNEKSTIHVITGSQWALSELTKHEIGQEYLCIYLNVNEALTRKERYLWGSHIGGRDGLSEKQGERERAVDHLMLGPQKPMASAWQCPSRQVQ